ncbi:MAG: hypothetical protein COA94_07635 [Rickettsiales bacterium]|nr:MAG: hypothetical protein COA94_07635 [Rickettsiales bacterium]
MNIYSIYTNPNKNDDAPVPIKQGFSLVAGLFNLFWALYHKMWSVALFMVLITTFIGAIDSSHTGFSVNIMIMLTFAIFASDLMENRLTKRGFKLDDIILAANEEEAEIRYFMRKNSNKSEQL